MKFHHTHIETGFFKHLSNPFLFIFISPLIFSTTSFIYFYITKGEIMNSMSIRSIFCVPIIGFILLLISGYSQAQSMATPSPAPSPNDGSAIDQGIAYLLMLVALGVTYLVH